MPPTTSPEAPALFDAPPSPQKQRQQEEPPQQPGEPVHVFLLSKNYTCYGPDPMHYGAVLYQKITKAGNAINVWRYEVAPPATRNDRGPTKPPSWQVEAVMDTGLGFHAKAVLYTFTSEALQERLADAEGALGRIWRAFRGGPGDRDPPAQQQQQQQRPPQAQGWRR